MFKTSPSVLRSDLWKIRTARDWSLPMISQRCPVPNGFLRHVLVRPFLCTHCPRGRFSVMYMNLVRSRPRCPGRHTRTRSHLCQTSSWTWHLLFHGSKWAPFTDIGVHCSSDLSIWVMVRCQSNIVSGICWLLLWLPRDYQSLGADYCRYSLFFADVCSTV